MKIRYGLVLTFATVFGLAGCASGGGGGADTSGGPAPSGAGSELLQGERPRSNEDTRAAERALEQANEAADEAQAETFFRQALEAAQAGITADPTNPLSHYQAGIASLGLDDYEAADMHLSRAEELRPIYELETEGMRERAWLGLYEEATPFVNSGDYAAAAEIFEQANMIYYQRPEVMITLGQIYAQLRQHDKSIENIDQALALLEDPEILEGVDEETLAGWQEAASGLPLARAQVLTDAGRYEEAATAFRALVAENPNDPELSRSLAAILVQMGETEEAFAVYSELLSRPGMTSPELYNIGVGFYQGGDYEQAAMAFGRSAEESPMNRDAVEMWARSLQLDSAWADAQSAAERWHELDPNNSNALLILAQSVNQLGDSGRASELIHEIEALQVVVNDMQMQGTPNGATVFGSVTNKLLESGARVTLTFTFYDTAGNAIGEASQPVAVADADVAVEFQLDFQSATPVAGYSYAVTAG